jgi:tetratricopeptide (TPR) repeat protein
MELDQLYKKLNTPLQTRLSFLEEHLSLVKSRDDLYLERITLYNQVGEYEKAKHLIAAYKFHPWEGGEGKVVGQYLIAHIELAKAAIEDNQFDKALQLLQAADNYPENLGEGKLYGTQENDINYLKGLAYEYLGEQESAKQFYKLATGGISEPVQAIFYNDPQPDKIFYRGLAWMKLHEHEKAKDVFNKLISFGSKHFNDKISIDYFAVSLPDLLVFDADLDLRNKIHCLYLQALGKLGLGNENLEEAESLFDEVLSLDVNHQGAAVHKKMLKRPALLSTINL